MINKAKQIREFKQANPSAPINKIADACNATAVYVYQVLHKMQKKKAKPVAAPPTAGQETLRAEILRLNEHIADLKYERTQMDHLMNEYREECRKLKLHHGGLEYIISYLESRLGIKEQDGITV